MGVLILNILLICFYSFVINQSHISSGAKGKVFLAFVFLHLLFLYVFKDPSEFPDLDEYEIYLKDLSTSFGTISFERENDRVEFGWYFINKINRIIFGYNFTPIIIFSSVVTLSAYLTTFKRYSHFLLFSVFIFYCTYFYPSLFVLRQHMAMPICLLTIPYILNRDFKRFIFITAVAVLFHYSAIIWIPTYFLYKVKLNAKFIFASLVVFVLLSKLLELILNNIAIILPIVASYGADAFDGVATQGGAYKPFISMLLLVLFAYKINGGFSKMKDIEKFCMSMMVIGLFLDVFFIIGSSFAEFSRLNLYFESCAMIMIPNTVSKIKDRPTKVLSIALLSIYYLLTLGAFVNYGFQLNF